MKINKSGLILLLWHKVTLTTSSLWGFATEASLLSRQRGQTRAVCHFLQPPSRQCIGTVDTRLCSVEGTDAFLSIREQWITQNQCWVCDNSVHANSVKLTLVHTGQSCTYTYRLWVGQWPEPVVVLLSGCIPQTQIHWFPIHHYVGRVVVEAVQRKVEISFKMKQLSTFFHFADHTLQFAVKCSLHCGDVLSREGIGSVADEQACFTNSPVRRKQEMMRNEDHCSLFFVKPLTVTVFVSSDTKIACWLLII